MFVDFGRWSAVKVIHGSSALRKSSAAPEWPHFTFYPAQGLLATGAEMVPFRILIVLFVAHGSAVLCWTLSLSSSKPVLRTCQYAVMPETFIRELALQYFFDSFYQRGILFRITN